MTLHRARILIASLLHALAARIDTTELEPIELILHMPDFTYPGLDHLAPSYDPLTGHPIITYKPTSYD